MSYNIIVVLSLYFTFIFFSYYASIRRIQCRLALYFSGWFSYTFKKTYCFVYYTSIPIHTDKVTKTANSSVLREAEFSLNTHSD